MGAVAFGVHGSEATVDGCVGGCVGGCQIPPGVLVAVEGSDTTGVVGTDFCVARPVVLPPALCKIFSYDLSQLFRFEKENEG